MPARSRRLCAGVLWFCALQSESVVSLSLHEASEKGNITEVLQLLASGVPVDQPSHPDMKTALMAASARRRTSVVRVLLEAGADVNGARDASGATALQVPEDQ